MTEKEVKELVEKHNLTKEYLRRALRHLNNSLEYYDDEKYEAEEHGEKVSKFIEEVKRRRLV